MSGRIQGVLWLLLAAALAVWATIDFSILKPTLSGLCFIYGVLLLVRERVVNENISLNSDELSRYGEKLSEATPHILAMFDKKVKVKTIADKMDRRFGIPKEITLKYIIALGHYNNLADKIADEE